MKSDLRLRPSLGLRTSRGRYLAVASSFALLLATACASQDEVSPGAPQDTDPDVPSGAPDTPTPTTPQVQEPPTPPPPSAGEESDPDVGIDLGDVGVRIEETTSSRVELSWDPIEGAEEIRVFVGPEPKGSEEQLPLEGEVARLDGAATSHSIDKLAASTDVFVRLEATTASGRLWGIAHARTRGGPRVALDTPLRSVHAVAPNVLMLVLETRETRYSGSSLQGARGAAWQGGQWRVSRADGTELPVTAVRRRSIPVGQPSYPVGWEKWGTDNVVDIDDHLFLVLSEPIGERELLSITHAGGSNTELDVMVPFSDRYLESPLIKVNQVGYNPRASKRYAYLHAYLGDGGHVDASQIEATVSVLADARNALRPKRVVAAELPVSERSAHDAEAGGRVHQVDLASIPPAEGVRYRVRVPGVGVSYPTAVSEDAALKAFYVVARGLYLNRWCGDLDEKYTDWSRGPDHCRAYFVSGRSYRAGMFPANTPKSNERPVVGGHHDAGDFDIRPFHVVVAQYLLRAFEANRDALLDDQLDIPESGNGIPDLLDEALHSVRAWEDLQNEDGSVRAGVESSHHPRGYYYADEDRLAYWTYDPEPWHTAYVAGLFAQASHLVRPYDAKRAEALLQRAVRASAWATRAGAPPEFRLYAASELARASGEATHRSAFDGLWSGLGGNNALNGRLLTWSHVYPGSFTGSAPVLSDYLMGYLDAEGANQTTVGFVRGALGDRARATAQRFLSSAHAMRNGRPSATPPDWGRSVATGLHADPIYQALTAQGSAQEYLDALSLAADYVLGGNPNGMSYVTGMGSVTPQEPLHTDSLAFIKDKGMPPMPGLPVYGPVANMPGSSWYAPLAAAFHPSFGAQPLGLRYVDARTAVNMSEFSVWESQAPLVALFATLAPKKRPPLEWAAGGSEHRSGLVPHRVD